MSARPEVLVWTDGACSGNPGPGGWGAVLVAGSHRKELSGAEPDTTNNRMELVAALRALERLSVPSRATIVTDSQYVKNGIQSWIHGWLRNGWKTASKQPVKNEDLWRRLLEQTQRHEVDWKWVKGHAGDVENERCDRLAVAGARRAAKGERGEKEGSPRLELPPEGAAASAPPAPAVQAPKTETLRATPRGENARRAGEAAGFGPAARSGKGERVAEGNGATPARRAATATARGRAAQPEPPADLFGGGEAGSGPGRNLELKIRAEHEELRRRALAAGARAEAVLDQVDEFFAAPAGGRLKLRSETRRTPGGESIVEQRSELIWYSRADEAAARLSDYERLPVDEASLCARMLERSNGRLGRVVKRRELLRMGPARLHLDRVEALGEFVEIEWVLQAGEEPESALPSLERLLQVLGLDGAAVESRSYRDLLAEAGRLEG